jgi:SSS family solute:Na+ symporter
MGKLTVEALVSNLGIESGFLADFAAFNFLYYSGVLLLISIAIVVGVSLAGQPQPEEQIRGLTLGSLSVADKKEIRASWDKWDIIGTGVVLGLVVGMYLYFSFWLG